MGCHSNNLILASNWIICLLDEAATASLFFWTCFTLFINTMTDLRVQRPEFIEIGCLNMRKRLFDTRFDPSKAFVGLFFFLFGSFFLWHGCIDDTFKFSTFDNCLVLFSQINQRVLSNISILVLNNRRCLMWSVGLKRGDCSNRITTSFGL